MGASWDTGASALRRRMLRRQARPQVAAVAAAVEEADLSRLRSYSCNRATTIATEDRAVVSRGPIGTNTCARPSTSDIESKTLVGRRHGPGGWRASHLPGHGATGSPLGILRRCRSPLSTNTTTRGLCIPSPAQHPPTLSAQPRPAPARVARPLHHPPNRGHPRQRRAAAWKEYEGCQRLKDPGPEATNRPLG